MIQNELRDYHFWHQTAEDLKLHAEAADRIDQLEAALVEIRDIALVSDGVEFYAMLAEKGLDDGGD